MLFRRTSILPHAVHRFSNARCMGDYPDDQLVEQREKKENRADKVDEQYDAVRIAVIPNLVWVAVIKYQALPVLPAPNVVSDSNPAATLRPWND